MKVLAWVDYVNDDMIKGFEETTGITVNLTTFGSQRCLLEQKTKAAGANPWDRNLSIHLPTEATHQHSQGCVGQVTTLAWRPVPVVQLVDLNRPSSLRSSAVLFDVIVGPRVIKRRIDLMMISSDDAGQIRRKASGESTPRRWTC